MKRLQDNTAKRLGMPFSPGEDVGYNGERATVVYVPVNGWDRIKVELPDGTQPWVRIVNLHDAPPLSEEIQQAALDAAAVFADPRGATFGGRK